VVDDVNPYAKYVTPQADENPYAKYVTKKAEESKVGYGEDIAKGIIPAAVQGIMSVAGMPGDLQALAKAGSEKATEKGINPFSALGNAFANSKLGQFLKAESAPYQNFPTGGDMPGNVPLPTSAGIQKKAEEVTGPFYESQTGPGKAVQTGLRVAPALLAGGEGLPGAIAKATGAGIVGEGAAEGASALKGHLPDAAQPWAEPVARAAGVMAGSFTPAGVRKAATPLPLSPERAATVNALRAVNPELVEASTAGQLAEAPGLMTVENRSPRMADLPQRQGEAYTQGVMRQAGSGGMFDTAGLAEAKNTGAQIDALRNAHNMSPAEFANLRRGIGHEQRQIYPAVGNPPAIADIREQILNGPSGGNPPPLNMTGDRYGALKQITQAASQGAPSTHEQIAIGNIRRRMTDAFHRSMRPDEAQRLRDLDQQYSNFKTIENIPIKVGENTVTPQQVFSKAARGSPLETHAENAASVMGPLPKPNKEGGSGTKILGSILGGLGGGGAGLYAQSLPEAVGAGLFGSYYGMNHLNDVVQAVKNVGGRAAAHPAGQWYLKNQAWRPGAATSADQATLLRLLMAPPTNPTLVGPQQ